jgi:hypothetical protein
MNKTTLTIIGAALVAILSLGYAGYSMSIPHIATVTEQEYVTNAQDFYSTQTQSVTATNTVTSTTAVANNALNLSNGGGPGYYQSCGYYGCYPSQGYQYTPCTSVGSGTNTVTCYGYLIQSGNGCTQISVLTTDPDYWRSGIQYVHYTLQDLPASYPSIGNWVDVTGQLSITNTSIAAANSAACSPNTLSVTSITPTNAP